jgi:hypothetical protein
MEIVLGKPYIDITTGFKGVAAGHSCYMTGCSRVILQASQGPDGKDRAVHCDDSGVRLCTKYDEPEGLQAERDKFRVPLDHPKHMYGKEATDSVTGYKGTVTGSVIYFPNGMVQLMLAPKVGKDGKRGDGEWFDMDRVKVKGVQSQLARAKDGADSAPPSRPSH